MTLKVKSDKILRYKVRIVTKFKIMRNIRNYESYKYKNI